MSNLMTTAPMADYAAARQLMVDGQVRPNKVNDARILAAMRSLPRERFVPADRAALAYSDEDVALGGGRFLMEPMVTARLVQMAAVQDGERALVVGAGTGYGAALLALCGATVTALESDPALLAIARVVVPSLTGGVAIVEGNLADGWKATAPYDVILIEGAVPELPPAVVAQIFSRCVAMCCSARRRCLSRNGWPVMCGCSATDITSASPSA